MKKKHLRWIFMVGMLGLLAIACKLSTQASPPGDKLRTGGQIAFLSDRGRKTELYTIDPDGSKLKQITHNQMEEMSPVWSPGGEEIAFTGWPEDSVFDEDSNIFIAQLNGADPVQVTFMNFTAVQPRWSPRGDYIAYISDDPGVTDIYMVNVSTKKMTKISQENLGPDLHMVPWQISPPNWSSDGKWIVYATAKGDEGYWDIYKYAVDKGETVQITHSEAGDLEPVWSPDGKHIAFIRYLPEKCENDCDVELFVMNSDGSGEIRLTDHPGVDAYPVWSPDSKRIAFLSQREDNLDIYVINWDGSGLKRLTDDPADDYDHNWSPDGKEIVFVSERDGNAEIYKVNVDGGAAVNLTQDTADDRSPVWSAGIPTR